MLNPERKIRIAHSIYPAGCLEAAIERFATRCEIKKESRSGSETIISFHGLSLQMGYPYTIIDEFLNYLLNLSMRRQLQDL